MRLDLRSLLAGDRLLTFDDEISLCADSADPKSYLFGVDFPSPMKVKGEITNTAGYMRMTLSASVCYHTSCARCLSPISGRFDLSLEKTVTPKDMLSDLTDVPDDYVIIEDGFLDLDEIVDEQMELEFPSRFLCREDCKGLCPRCGKNLNEEACDCLSKEIDPRMAPLQALLDRMKQEEKNN